MPSPEATLVLLLLGALSLAQVLVGKSKDVYGPLTGPVPINIVGIDYRDTVVWKSSDNKHIAKWKDGPVGAIASGFRLLSNKALQVDQNQNMTLIVEVNDVSGTLKKKETIQLIRIETLPKPTISHTCQGTLLEFACFVERGRVKEFTVTKNGTKVTGTTTSTMFNASEEVEATVMVKCIVKNEVGEESHEVAITCDKAAEWDILLIASVAGGGVALIIFIVLLIYCVLRCHELRSASQNSEEEMELSSGIPSHDKRLQRPPGSTIHPRCQSQQQRQLPHPQKRKRRPQQEGVEGQQGMKVTGQGVLQEKRVQSRSAVLEKRAQGQPASQEQTVHSQPVVHQKHPPRLPPHHPSSCSQTSPIPAPRMQQRSHPHHNTARQ
ncbi:T-cell surface antigen CD2 [Pleurodeles waltl]|uniref:T-cell surface antigen CD2 n=1 Tax=Pleurodeles waltl TaxID=8319 RepID=UPI00370942D1